MGRVRIWLATILSRVVARLVEGGDDRVVVLNVKRRRSRYGPRAGRVNAFVSDREESAPIAFAPDDVPRGLGLPVSIHVARFAGKRVVTPRGS